MANGESSNKLGFTSAIALAELVGREEILKDIEGAIFEDNKRIVFLIGKGGIGKSRILAKLIEDWNEEYWSHKDEAYVANDLVDFYLTNYHLRGHLVYTLYEMQKYDSFTDPELEKIQERIDNFWIARIGQESEELRQDQLDGFDKLLEDAWKDGKRVIFFFDTAEKLVYTWPDELQEVQPPWADAWDWLLELLEKHDNLYLVVAGRAKEEERNATEMLFKGAEEKVGEEKVVERKVKKFNDEEMEAYLDAVQKELEKEPHKYKDLLKFLTEELPTKVEVKKQIFHSANGIPIRLALTLDLFVSPKGTGSAVWETIDPEEWESLFLKKLAQAHPDLYEILIAMGWLPKGTDAALLAIVMNRSPKKTAALLEEIEKYSFIKTIDIPNVGRRHFLHDELYRILKKTPDYKEKPPMERVLDLYYEVELERVNKEIREIYEPILFGDTDQEDEDSEGQGLDTEQLVKLFTQRHALQVEAVYYSLQGDEVKGIQRCYRYVHDADLSGDIALDYALEAELLAFVNRYTAGTGDKDEKDIRERVTGMLAMRPVVRAWVLDNFDEVVELARKRREEKPISSIFEEDTLNAASLNVWEAYARTYRASKKDEPKVITDLFKDALQWTENYLNSHISGQAWRAQAIRAFAYRVRAYYWTKQEIFEKAAQDYRLALDLWEVVELRAEIAATLNDGGYTLARMGKIHLGQLQVREALKEREKLVALGPLGLSVNTLALVQLLMGGSYDGAVNDAQRALELFTAIEYPRGIGLSSLALSEAKRRRLEGWLGKLSRHFKALEEIEFVATQAVEALEQKDTPDGEPRIIDTPYYIKALIELGCVWRDKAKYCAEPLNGESHDPCKPEKIKEYRKESKEILEEARKAAGQANILALEVEALVNLAWLGYYSKDEQLTEDARSEIEEVFKKREDIPIIFDNDPRLTPENRKHKELWEQLGKLYMALGTWQYEQYIRSDQEKQESEDDDGAELTEEQKQSAVEMGRLCTLSLQYSSVRGEQYANFIRAQAFLYKMLRGLMKKDPTLGYFIEGISAASWDYRATAIWTFLQEWEFLSAEKNGG